MTRESRLLMRRNIRDRAHAVAPLLTFDPDPYIVVTADGRLVWMMDGFTTSDMYPYSRHYAIGNTRINYMRNSVKAVIDGTWKTGFYYGNIKDGFTDVAKYGPKVSAATKAKIAAKRQAMISGKFIVFEGPIYDQSGKLRVPAGQRLKVLPDLYAMNWLVKGVIGSPKG